MTLNSSKHRRRLWNLSRRRLLPVVSLIVAILAPSARLGAQDQGQVDAQRALAPQVAAQMNAIVADMDARTLVERKINSRLLYAARRATGSALAAGVPTMRVSLPMTADGRVVLDVRALVSNDLIDRLRGLGVEIVDTSATYQHIGVRAPLSLVE